MRANALRLATIQIVLSLTYWLLAIAFELGVVDADGNPLLHHNVDRWLRRLWFGDLDNHVFILLPAIVCVQSVECLAIL